MAIVFFINLCFSVSYALAIINSGCGKFPSVMPGSVIKSHSFTVVTDSNFPNTTRSYALYVPTSYNASKASPLMFYFHGQGGNALKEAKSLQFKEIGDETGMISVYPQGLGDGNCGTGWNVGSLDSHISSTCRRNTSGTCCYSSCKTLGLCSDDANAGCRWSTCHDDIAFVFELLQHLSSQLCIDIDHVFSTGASNGGMMQHWLYAKLPKVFKSFVPVYGLPLVGFLEVLPALESTWIMAIHDRSDDIIPDQGGFSPDGWNYVSSKQTYGQWAKIKGCNAADSPIVTPYDGGFLHMACTEWQSCRVGRVVHCLYDGEHGSWPENEEKLTYWFWNQTF